MTLVSKIEGPVGSGDLVIHLAELMAEHGNELIIARNDREERVQAQLIRNQQDEAYEESLKADKEKQRKKIEMEEAKKKEIELQKAKIEQEKEAEEKILNRKVKIRREFLEKVEPSASDPLAIKICIKLPDGSRIERFFLKTDPLSSLHDYVFCNENCPKHFEIVTNFPRKCIECTSETTTISLQDVNINQSMLLFVNDLDA
jgi:FAS-associated factor 2